MIRIFKHYIPKPLIALTISEILIFLVSVPLAESIRFLNAGGISDETITKGSVVFALIMVSCMTAMGLYRRHWRDGMRGMFLRLGIAFLLGFVIMTLLFYLVPEIWLGRGIFGITWLLSLCGVAIARVIYVRWVNWDNLKHRIIVAGVGEKAALIDKLLKRRSDRQGFKIVGYVPINDEPREVDETKVVPHSATFLQLCELSDADEVVIAVTDRRKGLPVDELLDCKMSGISVEELQTFFERHTGRIILKLLHPSWLIFSDGFAQGNFREIAKRLFDVSASSLLLLVAFPVMLATALAIYLEDRGPVFYKQVRVGKNWQLFQVIKFRSMRPDAEKAGAQFAQEDDDRITRVGRFIRKTRIDELPQLLNVLRGEMSFVGPRPERPEFVEQFSVSIPFYAERHRVKPGITGWAQIMYPYGSDEKDTIEKLQYDLYYVKNYSLFLDLMILFQTAEVVIWGKGAR